MRGIAGRARFALVALMVAGSLTAQELPLSEKPLWQIDPGRSVVTFSVRALGLFAVEGRIDGIDGLVWRDGQTASVQVRADLNRLKMSTERRRQWALSAEFFDAENFPQLTFTASLRTPDGAIVQGGLRGQLNLHGVTETIMVQIDSSPCSRDAQTCLVHGEASVSRSRFGMRSRRYTLGDQVALDLALHLRRIP